VTLVLIDGHALAYRAYFAFAGAPLRNSKGEETGAVYGFLNTLVTVFQRHAPSHIAVAFDGDERTFRHDAYAEYKANRPATPDGLLAQLPVIFAVLDAMRVARLEAPGFEADDIIATLARRYSAQVPVLIVSGDKDLLQLIDSRVRVVRPGKGSVLETELGPEGLLAATGLRADQFVDYLALVGDTSDNVPGVRGIGGKTALELLQRFDSLDALYTRLDEIAKPALRAKLESGRDAALHSRDLVRLRDDVPIALDLEALARRDHRTPEFASLLEDLEFRRMREQLFRPPGQRAATPEPEREPERAQAPRAPAPAVAPVARADEAPVDYLLVDTELALRDLARDLASADAIAVDTETSGVDPMRAVLAGIAIAREPAAAWYIPVASELGGGDGALSLLVERAPGLDVSLVREVLGPLLASERPAKIGQHIKYDAMVLKRAGLPLGGIAFDTMLASYCLDPSRRSHGLDALALDVCGHTMIPFESLFDRRARERDIRRVPLARVVEYACEDADYTLRLQRVFQPLIEASEVKALFHDVEMPLSSLLMQIEMTGVRVDVPFLDSLSRRYTDRIGVLEESIYAAVGERFNPASTPKLQQVLFERLKLAPSRKTKTGFSTDADVLETLRGQHAVVDMLLEWRQLVKLKGTYVDALPRLVHPETGFVHTSFNQAVASTGRLSSSDPNLQNIPIRTPEGREIRRAFIARAEGWSLLDADYSQIELRILAHLSGDEGLCEAFRNDEDVHRATASRVMKVPLDAVTDDMRARAKVVNFGIVYGMGARGLATSLGIDIAEAKDFIADYFRSYPSVKRFIDDTIARARRDHSVSTMLGRVRHLPDIDSSNGGARSFSERVAVNTPVQGTAADIIKLAMLKLAREIDTRDLRARMILQVHDELLFDVPDDEMETMRALVRGCMESALALAVPLKVDMGSGRNWLEAH